MGTSAFINRHITRGMTGGGNAATFDPSWLNAVNTWLTPADDLMHWVNPAFGTVKDGGGIISKIFNLGATRLPWGGDLTMATAGTTYVTGASGIGGQPAWSNSAINSCAYFGAARAGTIRQNSIRRLHYRGLTVVAVYKKSNTNQFCPISIGQFGGFALRNTSGNPGQAQFFFGGYGNAWSATDTSTATLANNTVHIIGGSVDPSGAVKVYVEGVAAGPGATVPNITSTTVPDLGPLIGGITVSNGFYSLVSGSSNSKVGASATSPDDPLPTFNNSEAQGVLSDIIVFGVAQPPSRMLSLNALLRGRYGP